MFSSLRTRLWLSYLLLILVVLGIIGGSLFVFLIRNQGTYRQAVLRLRVAESAIALRLDSLNGFQPDRLKQVVGREDSVLKARIEILASDGTVLADSRLSSAPALQPLHPPFQVQADDQLQPLSLRDANGGFWFYRIQPVDDQHYSLAAVPRPKLTLQLLLADELSKVFLRTGALALGMSILLVLLVGWWIAAPLRKMSAAAKAIADGEYRSLPLEGPSEVQDLSRAFNEMTQRVKLSQQAQQDFIANVSHELKTPLTSIQGFAQAILDGTASTPQALQQAATVIYNESGRMSRLVLDLLTLARLDAGTANLRRTPVDLAGLLKGVAEKMAPQARQAQINLSADILPLPGLIGDEDRLSQVFTNLVDNAIKYTQADGSVILSARQVGEQLEASVSDNGPGLSSADQLRIFERFFQADRSRRGGTGRGVGLGLAIARQIVLAHGGTIQVISSPSKGSQFIVRIPVARPDDATLVKRLKTA